MPFALNVLTFAGERISDVTAFIFRSSQDPDREVQTPLLGPAAAGLRVGDRVWFRHAKAGELCERFGSLLLLEGDRVVDEVPTYRGEGRAFL